MSSDNQLVFSARRFIGERDFDAAIELLSPLADPTPNEMYALADAYLLRAYDEESKQKSRALYRKALKLYSSCYAECSNPPMACRAWVVCAYVLADEKELLAAKKAGLRVGQDVQLFFFHYLLLRDRQAPENEQEKVVDEALTIAPFDYNMLTAKASILMRRREWKRAWECQHTAISYSDHVQGHVLFPRVLARTALLALVQGEDVQAFLEWGRELDWANAWVRLVDKVLALRSRTQQVAKAKELLTGEADFGDASIDVWLGSAVVAQAEEAQVTKEPDDEQTTPKRYTPSVIEQMGPEMRREIIVGLLVKALGRME